MRTSDQWQDIRNHLQQIDPQLIKSQSQQQKQGTPADTNDAWNDRSFRDMVGEIRFIVVFVAFFSLVINILMLVGPIYMMQVYDRVLSSGSLSTLIYLTFAAIALLLVSAVLEGVRSRILVRLGGRLDELISGKLFARLIEKAPLGEKSGCLRDLDTVRGFLTGSGLFFFFDAPWTPLFLIVMFILHPLLFLVAMSGASILFALAVASEIFTRQPLTEASNHLGSANQFTTDASNCAETVEAMGMTQALKDRWQLRHRRGLALQAIASDRAGILTATTKFVRPFLQIAILGVGAYLVLNLQITAGVMIAASIMMGRALAPVEGAIGNWRNFVLARAAYTRLHNELQESGRKYSELLLPKPKGDLSVENLVGTVPGVHKPIIKGISFKLSTGETLGIVGPSASGKSTLARLLIGVWPPAKGCVRLDGADVANWRRSELGPSIGYLSQSIELFDGTIAENISRFSDCESEAIISAAKEADVHNMILRLPDGYSTQVGSSGLVLSGGQRQRIGLARAIFNDPALVILDEPNSNLDENGEIALSRSLDRLKNRGSTIVIIAHRRSALKSADKIMVLRDGMVDLFGPASEVLQKLSQTPQKSVASNFGRPVRSQQASLHTRSAASGSERV
ncbi:MAG: type I secretion system permease/ATPase [Pseudomonadota bacterium]